MASYNKITLIGNVGNDPVFKTTPNGNKLAEFSIAYNENRGGANRADEKPTWFRATVWGDRADTIKTYVTKGTPIMVEGKLSVSNYIGQDGVPRQGLEIRVSEFVFLGGKGDGNMGSENGGGNTQYPSRQGENSPEPMSGAPNSYTNNNEADDDLPF
jgi:single-strand DNA-binding protein